MNDPKIYVLANAVQKRDAMELLEEYRDLLTWNEEERILDVGCGPGDVTSSILLPILPKDAKVVGCDVSEEMVIYANRHQKNDRISYMKLDIEDNSTDIPWKIGLFDKIFSFYCFQWIDDEMQAMRNIYSLLKPGGSILFVFPMADHPITMAISASTKSIKYEKYLKKTRCLNTRFESSSFYKNILNKIGFCCTNCYTKKRSFAQPTWKAVLNYLQSVNPYYSQIPENMRKGYLQDLAENLVSNLHVEHNEVNGGYSIGYNLMIITAMKPGI